MNECSNKLDEHLESEMQRRKNVSQNKLKSTSWPFLLDIGALILVFCISLSPSLCSLLIAQVKDCNQLEDLCMCIHVKLFEAERNKISPDYSFLYAADISIESKNTRPLDQCSM